jgi:DNA-binding NarL/FixJ family response regulator
LIRIGIIAASQRQAQTLAEALSEEERLEVVEARSFSAADSARLPFADVLLAVGLNPEQIPLEGPPIVLLGDGGDSPAFRGLVRAWLSRSASDAEIVAAIMAAASDLTVLTPEQSRAWLHDSLPSREDLEPLLETLTPRESEVLRMLAQGLANKEIAGKLAISDHTAKFHVAQILGKLGAASRTEAVTIGIRRGLIPI